MTRQLLFFIIWKCISIFIHIDKNRINHKEYALKLNIARFFGPIGLLIIGDSRAFSLNKFYKLLRFSNQFGITVCLSVKDSKIDEWNSYLSNPNGQKILIQADEDDTEIVFMLCGSNILKRKINGIAISLSILKTLVPDCFFCLIPPMDKSFLSRVYEHKYLLDTIEILNTQILNLFKNKTIDTSSHFSNWKEDKEWFSIKQDDFFYSNYADDGYRIPIIINSINRYLGRG